MKKVLIIGSGIAGMSAAISLAEKGIHSILVSPFPSERSQSVMAAGGINAVDPEAENGDSVAQHIEDTLEGGRRIAGKNAVSGLCGAAPQIIRQLEKLGTVFTRDKDGRIDRRAFGGQTFDRTCYCGASTGKQIVTALVMETRRYEAAGLVERRLWTDFHSALIRDGICYGALLYNEAFQSLEPVTADCVVMATGGQNALFGKTTGSTACDGYAAGKLFLQGAELKNLEFIQYHPTTIETPQKRMLISEAARGEGGRLYYDENGKRVYFMEDLYGPNGNLMPRDIVSRCIYNIHRQVFLDVSFLGAERIGRRIPEIRDLCRKYRNIDIAKEPVPVEPSVHFFMGGLAVDLHHETNIRNLFAVGECASIYHGANRLGGNSLLAAMYSGEKAAGRIAERFAENENAAAFSGSFPDFTAYAASENEKLDKAKDTKSQFPVMYIRHMLADNMKEHLGIVRDETALQKGISDLDFFLKASDVLRFDSSVLAYFNYSLPAILALAKATLVSALERKESRGAHFRSDHPSEDPQWQAASIIRWDNGEYNVRVDREGRYES